MVRGTHQRPPCRARGQRVCPLTGVAGRPGPPRAGGRRAARAAVAMGTVGGRGGRGPGARISTGRYRHRGRALGNPRSTHHSKPGQLWGSPIHPSAPRSQQSSTSPRGSHTTHQRPQNPRVPRDPTFQHPHAQVTHKSSPPWGILYVTPAGDPKIHSLHPQDSYIHNRKDPQIPLSSKNPISTSTSTPVSGVRAGRDTPGSGVHVLVPYAR